MNAVPRTARPGDELEELHARLDEIVRELATLRRLGAPDHVAAVVHGAIGAHIEKLPKDAVPTVVAALHTLIETLSRPTEQTRGIAICADRLAECSGAIAGCAATLSKCAEQLAKHTQLLAAAKSTDLSELKGLSAELRSLCALLAKPTTRTALLELPSGPARMTVHEERKQ